MGKSLGDANDEGNFGLEGFQDGGGGTGRRDVDDGGVRLGFGDSLKTSIFSLMLIAVDAIKVLRVTQM